MGYKHTYDTIYTHFQGITNNIYGFVRLLAPSFLYPTTTHPPIFLPVHVRFACPNDGWMGLCIKLCSLHWHTFCLTHCIRVDVTVWWECRGVRPGELVVWVSGRLNAWNSGLYTQLLAEAAGYCVDVTVDTLIYKYNCLPCGLWSHITEHINFWEPRPGCRETPVQWCSCT